ncbi:MAG: hypothetical protein MHMPM18_002288 [Marteilia pararefringens]
MSTLSTSATATPAAAVASCKATKSPRDISSGNNNKKENSEKSKSTTLQREASAAATAVRKNKRNQQAPVDNFYMIGSRNQTIGTIAFYTNKAKIEKEFMELVPLINDVKTNYNIFL